MQRLAAIEAYAINVSLDSAVVLGVEANSRHSLPLKLPEKRAAAVTILQSHGSAEGMAGVVRGTTPQCRSHENYCAGCISTPSTRSIVRMSSSWHRIIASITSSRRRLVALAIGPNR
jgi:hypothetical protein